MAGLDIVALSALATAAGAGVPAAGTIVSGLATAAGAGVSAAGTIVSGHAQRAAANFEARQLDERAKEEQAASQIEAQQLGRRRNLALSALQTRAAASGFSATDPTTLQIGDEIAKYGTMQEQTALYGGSARRRHLEAEASGTRYTGEARRVASNYTAAATVLGGVSNLALRYGSPKPPTEAASAGPADYYYPRSSYRPSAGKTGGLYG